MRNALLLATLLAVLMAGSAQATREPSQLNVSIALFDPGIPADRSSHRDLEVFPRVRQVEALYLPFVLRDTLIRTGEWGAIRVVPDTDIAAELLVLGRIVHSDGSRLTLHVRALDASGRVWIDRAFAGTTQDTLLYDSIATELEQVRASLTAKQLGDIVEISLLRYAQQLAPDAFDDYLSVTEPGQYALLRLPASGDPMLARIERIRGVEYIFTDAVDAKFLELSRDVETVYELWREYRRQFQRFKDEETLRRQASTPDAPRGSYEAILERYEHYKWDRQAVEEQENWAVGFENEMGPTVDAIEERVDELESWVEDRYAEWQRLLAELFAVETGFTAEP